MKFEIGGYYLVGDRVFQIKGIEKTSYYCYIYNLAGKKTSDDHWSKSYVEGWASKRVKPKGPKTDLLPDYKYWKSQRKARG